jgi:hypothetical protein
MVLGNSEAPKGWASDQNSSGKFSQNGRISFSATVPALFQISCCRWKRVDQCVGGLRLLRQVHPEEKMKIRVAAMLALFVIAQPTSAAAETAYLSCVGTAWIKGKEGTTSLSVLIDFDKRTVDGIPASIDEKWVSYDYSYVDSGAPLYVHGYFNRINGEAMICYSRKPYRNLVAGDSCESSWSLNCERGQRKF